MPVRNPPQVRPVRHATAGCRVGFEAGNAVEQVQEQPGHDERPGVDSCGKVQAPVDKRAGEIDAAAAAADADWAEADAKDAIELAAVAIESARGAVLSAMLSRSEANARAAIAAARPG
jgi:hypothetical protein